jgi:hypothetical protein
MRATKLFATLALLLALVLLLATSSGSGNSNNSIIQTVYALNDNTGTCARRLSPVPRTGASSSSSGLFLLTQHLIVVVHLASFFVTHANTHTHAHAHAHAHTTTQT